MKYMSCPQCHKRMRKFRENSDQGHVYYFCPNCKYRCTYLPDRHAMSDGWPREVSDEAVGEI